MNIEPLNTGACRATRGASTRMLLVAIGLIAAAVIGAFLVFDQRPPPGPTLPADTNHVRLSPASREVLQNLGAPVELRYYRLLDTNTLPGELISFANRVDHLVDEFEREASGKLRIVRISSPTSGTSARDDGVRAFNLDRGDPSLLGIALQQGPRKESLPRLYPEWETALEADLTRAIARIAEATPSAAATQPILEAQEVESLKRALPDLAELSLDEARTRILQSGQAEFRRVGTEWHTQIQQAQQQVSQAESRSDSEHAAALQRLLELEAARTKALAEIVDRVETQIRTVEQLKSTSR